MKITKYKQVWGLWSEYECALKEYVFKHTQNDVLAQDIVQGTLLKVHKSCCSDREIKNIRSWLFQIAHNTMVDFFKEEKKNTDTVPLQLPVGEYDIYKELSIYVEPLIGLLPEKYAIPLKMADIEGVKQEEIAQRMGLGLSATKSRIQRARKLLKEKIHACFHTDACANTGLSDFRLKSSCAPLKKWEAENR